jgi:hypothetical protein
MNSKIKFTIPLLRKLGFIQSSKYDWEIENENFLVLVYFDPIWHCADNGKGSFMFKGGDCINFDSVNDFIDIFFNLTSIKIDINNI